MSEKMCIERLGNVYGEQYGTNFAGNVWNSNLCCPTITCLDGGGRQPMIIVKRLIGVESKSASDSRKVF